MSFIQKSRLLRSLDPRLQDVLCSRMEIRKFQRRGVVLHCGHPVSALWFVRAGEVEVRDARSTALASLKSGAVFGEQACLDSSTLKEGETLPSPATFVACAGAEVLILHTATFRESALGPYFNPRPEVRMRAAALARVDGFASMRESERVLLAEVCCTGYYRRGDALLRQGTYDQVIVIVASGEVLVQREEGVGRPSLPLCSGCAPVAYGAHASLQCAPHNMSVIAQGQVIAYILPASAVLKLIPWGASQKLREASSLQERRWEAQASQAASLHGGLARAQASGGLKPVAPPYQSLLRCGSLRGTGFCRGSDSSKPLAQVQGAHPSAGSRETALVLPGGDASLTPMNMQHRGAKFRSAYLSPLASGLRPGPVERGVALRSSSQHPRLLKPHVAPQVSTSKQLDALGGVDTLPLSRSPSLPLLPLLARAPAEAQHPSSVESQGRAAHSSARDVSQAPSTLQYSNRRQSTWRSRLRSNDSAMRGGLRKVASLYDPGFKERYLSPDRPSALQRRTGGSNAVLAPDYDLSISHAHPAQRRADPSESSYQRRDTLSRLCKRASTGTVMAVPHLSPIRLKCSVYKGRAGKARHPSPGGSWA